MNGNVLPMPRLGTTVLPEDLHILLAVKFLSAKQRPEDIANSLRQQVTTGM